MEEGSQEAHHCIDKTTTDGRRQTDTDTDTGTYKRDKTRNGKSQTSSAGTVDKQKCAEKQSVRAWALATRILTQAATKKKRKKRVGHAWKAVPPNIWEIEQRTAADGRHAPRRS